MADITGTSVGETINGTGDADLINALGGNDIVNAGAGNDVVYGGTGNDTLNGEDGDDTFVEDQFTTGGDIFNGGSGFDTIELRAAPSPLVTSFGLLSPHSLSGTGQLTSIERILFSSQAGQVVQASLNYATWAASGITQIVGGAGRDFLTISVGAAAGTYTMPVLPLSGWDVVSTNAWEHTGDFVVLSSAASVATSVTLNALAGASYLQVISGGQGNDVLNGSANADWLDARAGADQVNAGDGNDAIIIVNSYAPTGSSWNPQSTFTGAGGVWDGGAGTDVVSIGGNVFLQATLIGIEGFYLQAPVLPPTPIVAKQDAAYLILDSARISMLPGNAFFAGTGTVEFQPGDGASFNASAYTFTPGSSVNFAIYAGEGDGLTITGSTNGDYISLGLGTQTVLGGDGNDQIVFGSGTQSATGGAGSDRFAFGGPAIATVTDFVVGEDQIDFTDTDISNTGRLFDLLSQGGSGAVIGATTVDGTFQMTLQGISLASLSASDFVLGIGDGGMDNETGTAAAEYFFGQINNDIYHGGGGNDRFYGGGGVDQIFGEDGDDTIILDGVIAFGGTYDGGTGTDTLLLRANSASVAGGPATQYFIFPGAPGTGLVSVERIAFDSSANYALTFITTAAPGITEAIGGAGADVLVFVAQSSGTFAMPSFTLTNWSANDAVVLTAQTGTAFDVTLNGRSDIGQFLIGQGGNDTLNGGALADTLRGGTGNDTLAGNGGADLVYGEAGNDRVVVGNNGVSVDGGADTDTLAITGAVSLGSIAGIEAIELAAGSNLTLSASQVMSGLAFNTVVSGTGTVTVNLGAGVFAALAGFQNLGGGVNFVFSGSTGSDFVKAGHFLNTISGGDGQDFLRGGNLVDTIDGGAARDKITGWGGADLLTGGGGNDLFRYLFASDSGVGAAADRITDFTIGSDVIDLQLLDSNLATPGIQNYALGFIGSAAFGATGASQIRYGTSGADMLVQFDLDGNGSSDMEIILQGLAGQSLSVNDFLFGTLAESGNAAAATIASSEPMSLLKGGSSADVAAAFTPAAATLLGAEFQYSDPLSVMSIDLLKGSMLFPGHDLGLIEHTDLLHLV